MAQMKMSSIISFIVVVAIVFNLSSTTFAISGGRALNNIIQLHSSDQSQSEINSQDGKIVTIIEPASLEEVLFESLSQKNQCWGKFCAPWSLCQPGCFCVGPVGTGACVGPPK
ncbi:hypothetical protein CsatB_002134 [Cannabis sativa]